MTTKYCSRLDADVEIDEEGLPVCYKRRDLECDIYHDLCINIDSEIVVSVREKQAKAKTQKIDYPSREELRKKLAKQGAEKLHPAAAKMKKRYEDRVHSVRIIRSLRHNGAHRHRIGPISSD